MNITLTTIAITLTTMAFSSVSAAEAPKLDDAEILGIYVQVNSFDIETALLGMSKGCSQEVKSLAEHIGKDHLAVRKGVLELAKEQNIKYVLPSSRVDAQKSHNETMAKLSALKCSNFDVEFLQHDIAFHTAAIKAVRTLFIPNTKNASLRQHFESVLPAFEEHLKMTKSVAKGKSPSVQSAH